MNRAPLWASEIVLLSKIFVSKRSAAGDAVSSSYGSLSPPIVSLTLNFSYLSGQ